MSLPMLLTQDIDILTAGVTNDRYGNPQQDWSKSTVKTVKGRLEPTDSVEITVDRDTVVSRWRLFLFPDAPIDAQKRVLVEGTTFEVAGKPAPENKPRRRSHIEARLVEIEG